MLLADHGYDADRIRSLFASVAHGPISHQREIEQKRYASVRIFTVFAVWSRGSSTRSSTVGVWQPATTSSEPTTSHSSNLHPYGCGCALMSRRPSWQPTIDLGIPVADDNPRRLL